jgi:hypothetical protein
LLDIKFLGATKMIAFQDIYRLMTTTNQRQK